MLGLQLYLQPLLQKLLQCLMFEVCSVLFVCEIPVEKGFVVPGVHLHSLNWQQLKQIAMATHVYMLFWLRMGH